PIHAVKPGATVLLSGKTSDRQEQVVLSYQRYGRGKSMAFSVQDSWIWKMDASMAVEDTTHATFWRKLVRWLVDGVPEPLEGHTRRSGASSSAGSSTACLSPSKSPRRSIVSNRANR